MLIGCEEIEPGFLKSVIDEVLCDISRLFELIELEAVVPRPLEDEPTY